MCTGSQKQTSHSDVTTHPYRTHYVNFRITSTTHYVCLCTQPSALVDGRRDRVGSNRFPSGLIFSDISTYNAECKHAICDSIPHQGFRLLRISSLSLKAMVTLCVTYNSSLFKESYSVEHCVIRNGFQSGFDTRIECESYGNVD